MKASGWVIMACLYSKPFAVFHIMGVVGERKVFHEKKRVTFYEIIWYVF